MSTTLIMILFTLFTCLCWCLLETGAIREYYRFPYIQYCPVWLYYCTSTLVPGLLLLPPTMNIYGFVFFHSLSTETSRQRFAMWKSLFGNASKFDSWRAALFNIVGVHAKLDWLTPDAASLFTTLWDCVVSSRDGWRDWDKRIKVIVVLLHCQTAAVGHYLPDALLLALCGFLGLFYCNLFISNLHGS